MKDKEKKEEVISMEIFRKSGKKGGSTTAKRGKKFYQDIGKKGAETRWNKEPPTP